MKQILLFLLIAGSACAQWSDFSGSTASSILSGAMNGKSNFQITTTGNCSALAGAAGKDVCWDTVSLFVATVTGSPATWKAMIVSGGALGTPSSGTMTNTTNSVPAILVSDLASPGVTNKLYLVTNCASPQNCVGTGLARVPITWDGSAWQVMGGSVIPTISSTSAPLKGDGAGNAIAVTGSSTDYIQVNGTATSGARLAASNTWSTGAQDFGSATSLKIPVGAGATTATNGFIAYDSTNDMLHAAQAGADAKIPQFTVTPANSDCVTWVVSGSKYKLGTSGAGCGGGGGVSSVSFTGGLISVANPTTTPAFTVAGNSGGLPYFSGAAAWASTPTWTLHTLMAGGGAGASPIITGITVDGSNNVAGVNSIALGGATNGCDGTAGCTGFGQGTAPSATVTNQIMEYAPTSVTAYNVVKPGAAATGFKFWTNSSNTVTETLVSNVPTYSGSPAIHQVSVFTSGTDIKGITVPASGTLFQGVTAADPSWTATPTVGVAGTTAGTIAYAGVTAGTFTIGATPNTTASNTLLGPASVPTTGHLLDCTTSSTTCTLHDSGVVTANVMTNSSTSTTTTQVAHATGVAGVYAPSAIVAGDLPSTLSSGTAITNAALTTPTLGVATATTINKVTITAPTTSATLTIADGKTHVVNNSITLAGTDSTTMTFPTTSATIARTDAANTFTGVQTMTSAALTTPHVTTILDGNGNPFALSSATASAVDSITVTNAATANPATVKVGATGTDSNINLELDAKGTGKVNLGSTNATVDSSGNLVVVGCTGCGGGGGSSVLYNGFQGSVVNISSGDNTIYTHSTTIPSGGCILIDLGVQTVTTGTGVTYKVKYGAFVYTLYSGDNVANRIWRGVYRLCDSGSNTQQFTVTNQLYTSTNDAAGINMLVINQGTNPASFLFTGSETSGAAHTLLLTASGEAGVSQVQGQWFTVNQ